MCKGTTDLVLNPQNGDKMMIRLSHPASAPQKVKREGDLSLRNHRQESRLPAVKVSGFMVAALRTA